MGRLSLWAVAMAAMMVTTILCFNSVRASSLSKPNATYGEAEVELMVSAEIARFLNFKDIKVHTENTGNRNVKSCDNGRGNQMGACDGSSSNKKDCNRYAGSTGC